MTGRASGGLHRDLLLAPLADAEPAGLDAGERLRRSWRGGTSRDRAGGRSTGCTRSTRDRSRRVGRPCRSASSVSVFFAERRSCRLDSSSIVLNFFRSFLFKRPPRSRAPRGRRKRAEKLFCVRWAVKAARAARPEAARSVPGAAAARGSVLEAGEPRRALLVCRGTFARLPARREVRPRFLRGAAPAHGALRGGPAAPRVGPPDVAKGSAAAPSSGSSSTP